MKLPEHNTQMRVILGFFAKRRTEALAVHAEAQALKKFFSDRRGKSFDFRLNPEPTFQTFSKEMLAVIIDNVRVVHFSGHGSTKNGLVWRGMLEDSSARSIRHSLCPIVLQSPGPRLYKLLAGI